MKKEDKLTFGVWGNKQNPVFMFAAFLFFMSRYNKTPNFKKVSFKVNYGIFSERSDYTADTCSCPWRRPRSLGRHKPDGRIWQ
jgi:hypothetical protein